MAGIPSSDKFIEPLLRFLAERPEGVSARSGQDGAAAGLGLSEEQKAQVLPSGSQHIYRNRAGWAHDRLKRAGFSGSPRRGYWQITPAGLDYLAKWPSPLTPEEVDRIATTNVNVPLRPPGEAAGLEDAGAGSAQFAEPLVVATPDDREKQMLLAPDRP